MVISTLTSLLGDMTGAPDHKISNNVTFPFQARRDFTPLWRKTLVDLSSVVETSYREDTVLSTAALTLLDLHWFLISKYL
jgi:hypothetical protein